MTSYQASVEKRLDNISGKGSAGTAGRADQRGERNNLLLAFK